jgi:hypothetical protein
MELSSNLSELMSFCTVENCDAVMLVKITETEPFPKGRCKSMGSTNGSPKTSHIMIGHKHDGHLAMLPAAAR